MLEEVNDKRLPRPCINVLNCIGCLSCNDACPVGLLTYNVDTETAKVRDEGSCLGNECSECVKVCPVQCIEIISNV